MNREFFDPRIERNVLLCLLNNENCFKKIFYKGLPDKNIFTDLSNRAVFQNLVELYQKYSAVPKHKSVLINHIKTQSGLDQKLKEKVMILAANLYELTVDAKDLKLFDKYYDELAILYNFRKSQEHIQKVVQHVDASDIKSLTEEIHTFNLVRDDEYVEEFEYAAGFRERFDQLKYFVQNYDKVAPIGTGIDTLDAVLDGGFQRELTIIAGNSSTGKSALLHLISLAAIKQKKNVILFTIEMNKIQAALRIDSMITGIPASKFRNPVDNKFGKMTNEDIKTWQGHIKIAKDEYGKMHIVAFLNGATVPDLVAKANEIMRREQLRIDLIAVDYLTDLKPVGKKYDSSKDWDAQGEISWALHMLTRQFKNQDGLNGVPVVTACTFKKQAKGITAANTGANDDRRPMDERDIGISPLLYQHADIMIGIRQLNASINQLVVMKNRGGKSGDIVSVYPNWEFNRFHDPDKAIEVANLVQQEREDSPDGIVIEEPKE